MDYNRILYGEIKFVPHNIKNNSNNLECNQNNNAARQNSNNNNNNNVSTTNNNNNTTNQITNGDGVLSKTKISLSDPNSVKLEWLHSEKIGGGLINVGNTCFLNSVLQCLTYCPPLYNYLIKQNGGHSNICKLNQFCMLCEMEKHIKRIKNSNGTPIKPISIVQRLKFINRSFQFGRQEDAHEFLRYLLDHMWKACLMNSDIKTDVNNNNSGDKIDPRIKETTAINHIFGGYHRSQVLCLSCNSRSNTFDFFMDIILDISNAKSLEESLKKFTQPETLERENAYKCSRCKKKVTARKRFSVYRAPNVATFQLKRFDSDRIFGGKITKYVSYPEELDLRPYMSDWTKSPIKYQLGAVLVHVGHSSNSGHYFCFIRNSNGFWYRMDDSNVTVVNRNVVLQQQAYILFYTRKSCDVKQQNNSNGIEQTKSTLTPISTSFSENNNVISNNNSPKKVQVNGISHEPPSYAPLTTWFGMRSKLYDDDAGKRKFSERDRFNEELDRGKRKKIKSKSRDEKFKNLSKSNPFQRYK